jgi:hypothetical protein
VTAPTPPPWVPPGPVALPPFPTPPHPDPQVLLDALAAIELGAYDRQVIDHLTWFLDRSVFAVIVSWLYRVRGVR